MKTCLWKNKLGQKSVCLIVKATADAKWIVIGGCYGVIMRHPASGQPLAGLLAALRVYLLFLDIII
jgi:hypothetical protein